MAKRTGPTNIHTKEVIKLLKRTSIEKKNNVWKALAEEIEKPRRIRREVNLYKVAETLQKGETAVIPGKLLASGEAPKDLKVAALTWSKAVETKVKPITIQQLIKDNPAAKNVRIIC